MEPTHRRAGDDGHKPRVARGGDTPPADTAEYLSKLEYEKALQTTYAAPDTSSRTTPQTAPAPPLGTWLIQPWSAIDGREIAETVELPVDDIEISENTGRERFADVVRYAGWLDAGLKPPPINVIQTDGGRLKTTDHRRLLAAKLAGRTTIKAFAWWATTNPRNGLVTGLTYELARQGHRPLTVNAARPGCTIHPDDARLLDEARRQRRKASGGPTNPVMTAQQALWTTVPRLRPPWPVAPSNGWRYVPKERKPGG